ncbi:hypothetical protein ACFPFV_02305 [Salinicoccus siamensis]|uniref:hypothetical protein n=1 Tax=Salinicoccus siamensis TaxID=381830 RepID=UPI0036153570
MDVPSKFNAFLVPTESPRFSSTTSSFWASELFLLVLSFSAPSCSASDESTAPGAGSLDFSVDSSVSVTSVSPSSFGSTDSISTLSSSLVTSAATIDKGDVRIELKINSNAT